jgi:hypothetical protein
MKNEWGLIKSLPQKDFIRSKKIQSFEGCFWSFIGFTKLKIFTCVCFNTDAG